MSSSSFKLLKETINVALNEYEHRCNSQITDAEKLRAQCAHQKNLIQELERFADVHKAEDTRGASRNLLELQEENRRLREKLDEQDVTINLMKTQLQVYKEDFNIEREDRQRAHEKISDLEKQISNFLNWYKQLPEFSALQLPALPSVLTQPPTHLPTNHVKPITIEANMPSSRRNIEVKTGRLIDLVDPRHDRRVDIGDSKTLYNITKINSNNDNEDGDRKADYLKKVDRGETFETGYITDKGLKNGRDRIAKNSAPFDSATSSFENIDFPAAKNFGRNFKKYVPFDADFSRLQSTTNNADEPLRCPRCLLVFPDNERMNLVYHMEKCNLVYR